ncbi:hypothetical protein [Anaerobutyricum hallii]
MGGAIGGRFRGNEGGVVGYDN